MEDPRVNIAASYPENFLYMPWAMPLLFPRKASNRKCVDKQSGSRATYYRRLMCITAIPFVTLQLSHQQGELEKAVAQSSLGPKATPVGCSANLACAG